jgi:hypothetical protein
MGTTLATQGDIVRPPGMGEFRRRALALTMALAAPIGALAACGGDGDPDVSAATAGVDEEGQTANSTPSNTESTTTTSASSTPELADVVCEADYVRGEGSYGNDYLYTAPVERADNCTSKELAGGTYVLGLTFFNGQVPASGPINPETYCEGTVYTVPFAAYGDGWVVEAMPTQDASPLEEDRRSFMEALASAAGGSVWTGSCPDNASIEEAHLAASSYSETPDGTIDDEPGTTFPPADTTPSTEYDSNTPPEDMPDDLDPRDIWIDHQGFQWQVQEDGSAENIGQGA